MDNREFAQVILCEAVEILNESGSRKKYVEALNKKAKRLELLASHSTGETKKKYEKELTKTRGELFDVSAFRKSKYTSDYHSKGDQIRYSPDGKKVNGEISTYKDENDNKIAVFSDGKKYWETKPYSGESPLTIDSSKEMYKKYIKDKQKKLSEKTEELHTNINNRARSQHESIAILLTEAAELLNENARWRKDIKNSKGFSLKTLGREAAIYKSKKNKVHNDDEDVNNMVSRFGDIYVKAGKSARNEYQQNEVNKKIEKIQDNRAFVEECKKKKANGIPLSQSDITRIKGMMKDNKSNEINKKINDRAKSQNESVAILLTEAAILLNENSKDMSDAYNKFVEAKDNFHKNHKERMNNLNELLKQSEEESKKSWDLINKNKKDLDDLLK